MLFFLIGRVLAISFFVIGDFGDLGDMKRARQNNLKSLTEAMDKTASEIEVDFILTTGDNIYNEGIRSREDFSYANKIMTNFEKQHLKNIPIYICPGNHDCYSDLKNEIEYSY